MILTAGDGEDVAELESPLGGHASQRATDMILGSVVDSKPPLCGHDRELRCNESEEAPAQHVVDTRQRAGEGDRAVEVGLAEAIG